MLERWSTKASAGVSLVLVVVAVGALLAGCGSSDSPSGKSSGNEGASSAEGTVHILLTSEIEKAMEKAGAGFEKANPNAKVEIEVVSPEQLGAVELTRMRSGSAPDLMQTSPGAADAFGVQHYAKLGLLMDLSDQSWAPEVAQLLQNSIKLDGKTYGFPTTMEFSAAIYNKEALADLGAEIPKTYGELLELCHTATDQGKTAIALGGQESFMNIFPGIALAASTVEPDFAQKRAADEATFTESEGWLESLEMFQEMGDEGCFGETPTGYGFTAAQQQVASGKAVALIGVGAFSVPVAEANPGAKLGIFPLPTAAKAADVRIPIAGGFSFAIANNAENPESAKAFLDYLAEHDEAFANESSSLPTVGFESLEEVPLLPGWEPMKPFMNETKAVEWETMTWPNPEVQNQWISGIQAMLSGDGTTPMEILEMMDTGWDAES